MEYRVCNLSEVQFAKLTGCEGMVGARHKFDYIFQMVSFFLYSQLLVVVVVCVVVVVVAATSTFWGQQRMAQNMPRTFRFLCQTHTHTQRRHRQRRWRWRWRLVKFSLVWLFFSFSIPFLQHSPLVTFFYFLLFLLCFCFSFCFYNSLAAV